MLPFANYLTEAPSQIAAIRKEAEAVRKRTVAQLEKKIREGQMSPDTKRYWKGQVAYYSNLNFDGYRSKYQLDNLVAKMTLAPKQMNADIKDDELHGKSKELVKKLKAMRPITLCDIMKSPNQRRFIELLVDGASEAVLQILKQEQGLDILYNDDMNDIPWMRSLHAKAAKLANWFSQEGGPKQDSISVIRECVACKGRGAWSKWSGKAYRGVGRSIARIKRYEYTGEIIKKDGVTWLVAKTNYKGKYGAQSWTPSWGSATGFNLGGDIQVIIEIDLKENESFLRPEVINRVSEYKGEEEVIRVSDRMVPATVYVKLYDIMNKQSTRPVSTDPFRKRDMVFLEPMGANKIKPWAEGLFGATAAKKLLANKSFVKEVS